MSKVFCDLSMSLDGYVAGPEQTLEDPLGRGGELLHEWLTRLKTFREQHGMDGGEAGPDNDVVEEWMGSGAAHVMGRRMFSGGSGPWEDDPNADGWWGDDPPFHAPVFVLTHHAREPVTKEGGTSYTFVTSGLEAALEQARRPPAEAASRSTAVRASCSKPSRPACWTSSTSTSCRCCSAAAACGYWTAWIRQSSSSRA